MTLTMLGLHRLYVGIDFGRYSDELLAQPERPLFLPGGGGTVEEEHAQLTSMLALDGVAAFGLNLGAPVLEALTMGESSSPGSTTCVWARCAGTLAGGCTPLPKGVDHAG
jgi:hypothetical protein